ncbi:MAG TPA: type IV toxin-antitoxin system AbiEi family antitoxin domain-containing protein [Acidimicrobiia bacterium]|nr:type IV toxin-antitoxin system AbiEi family antitoxin domain-containing protein [Acidimicrobiia bacterium]
MPHGSTRHDLDAQLHRLAGQQHGAVAARQALAIGLTRRQIDHRVSTGTLVVLRRGVFAPAGAPASWEQAVMAAVLAGGPGAVASHDTAARLWGLRGDAESALEISNARTRQHRIDGVLAHRFSVLDPDRRRIGELPLTSVARTVVDLSGRLNERQLGVLLDEALRRRATTIDDIAACANRLAPARGRRLALVQLVLAARGQAFEPGDSAFESRVMRAIRLAGLPSPAAQHRIRVGTRTYRVDLAYPERGIAIELDGYEFHHTRSAFDDDRRRGNDLVGAGLVLLRFTWSMSDADIVASIEQALSGARRAG